MVSAELIHGNELARRIEASHIAENELDLDHQVLQQILSIVSPSPTMFSRIVIFLALVVSAAAFSGVSFRAARSVSVKMSDAVDAPVDVGKSQALPFLPQPPNLVGMAGNVGFDPAGFSNLVDVRWLRGAELRHARICMLAVVGFVVSEFVHLPGEIHNISPVAAHNAAVKWGGLSQVNIVVHLFELLSVKAVSEMINGKSGRAPGDYGFDPTSTSPRPLGSPRGRVSTPFPTYHTSDQSTDLLQAERASKRSTGRRRQGLHTFF
jgi:hypothetical protein